MIDMAVNGEDSIKILKGKSLLLILISQHANVRTMERNFKDWNSETWPNHFSNELQECKKSSRKRESRLGKNEKGTRPVRLRLLFPELYEPFSDEEKGGEVNKSIPADDLSDDIATMVLPASSDEDPMGESSEDSYIGSSSVSNLVSTNHLFVVREEKNETHTVVAMPGSRKVSGTLDSGNWNVTAETSCNRSGSLTSRRSRFAEELQKLDLPSETKQLQFGSANCDMQSSVKIDGNGTSFNILHHDKPLVFKELKPKRDLVNSVNNTRPVLKDIGCSPLINSVQPRSDWNDNFYINAEKENMYSNLIKKSTGCSDDIEITQNNSFPGKILFLKNGLEKENLQIGKRMCEKRMPVGQNVETFFDSFHGDKFSSQLRLNVPREKLSDHLHLDEKKNGDFMPVCIKCLRKGGTKEKGIQREVEKHGEVTGREFKDKEVQCVVEKSDKCVTANLRLRSEEKAERTLVVKEKRYNVLSKLGFGGSSVVYQVLDPSTSSQYAVKCVSLPVEQEATARGYINEINLLQQLQDSDCVIALHDFEHVPEKEILYVVMEKGDTDLSRLIRDSSRKRTNLSVPMIVYYWTEMLNAVKCIHDHGIIHSDLKPANFLLVCGRLKLIDFGIASSVQSGMTSVFKESLTGTLNYMSPETITCCNSSPMRTNKYKVSYRSDVWSLGCILYSLIYGRTPFHHIENMYKKIAAITDPSTQISFPADERCPPILLETLKWCLVFDPKNRPTVAELLAVSYISGGRSRD